jgi:hypothetical protein
MLIVIGKAAGSTYRPELGVAQVQVTDVAPSFVQVQC